jgi:hypothetical protein
MKKLFLLPILLLSLISTPCLSEWLDDTMDDWHEQNERDLEELRDEINDMQHEDRMEAIREQTEELRQLRETLEDLND